MTRGKTSPLVLVHYPAVRHYIRDGDLLLFRRHGLIAALGRGDHCHAAKAAWWGHDLFCLEVLQWFGGRAVTLSSQVSRYPGRYDVFQANPDNRWPNYDRNGVARYMRRLCGCRYGYGGVLEAGLLHLPLFRGLLRADLGGEDNRRPPFCSQACAMADRLGGGFDPVEHLPDRFTEPADLARSPFYRYRFTLLP